METTIKRTVNISDKNIAEGERKNCQTCPGAKAILEAFPEFKRVSVFHEGVEGAVESKPDVYDYYQARLPEALETFMHDFDKGLESMQPVSFELEMQLMTLGTYLF